MRKLLLSVLLLSLTLTAFPAPQRGGGHSSSSRSSSSKSSSSKSSSSSKATHSDKPVHVKTYERKDGTVVRAHDRSAQKKKTSSSSSIGAQPRSTSTTPPKSSTVAARDSKGRIKRSAATRNDFMKQTGYPKGRSGYVVDHIVPLECGGADAPSNMQWQSVAEAKIKDRTERNCRR